MNEITFGEAVSKISKSNDTIYLAKVSVQNCWEMLKDSIERDDKENARLMIKMMDEPLQKFKKI